MPFVQQYLIAMGGNMPSAVGKPAETLLAAVQRLTALGVNLVKISRFFATPCFPVGAGPDYVNAAAALTFDGNPRALLEVLHQVEAEFGRARAQRWGQRTLDLDLLAADDLVLPDRSTYVRWQGLPLEDQMREAPGDLVLPHPRLHERAFVLIPLNDVASAWVHPILEKSVSEMLLALPEDERAGVVPIES